ncbi:hypothetical protein MMC17_001679 [Xylographa soralifera]|nr:hypothetical protein [Xylographa soralifera]
MRLPSVLMKAPTVGYLASVFLTWCSPVTAANPSAISVPVQTEWIGNDGSWSTVAIRVGNPPQWLNVFPSTASQETWVIGQDGCGESGPSVCSADRGGLFSVNASSSWQNVGGYELGLDIQLFGMGSGYYGYDTIALSENVSMPSQVISVVNETQYWLGFLGLGTKASNFTNVDKPTFLSSLANQTIPSLSYSYTAGASYQLKQVPSSLVLGGMDLNRYYPHNTTFALDPDLNPVVSINQVTIAASPAPTSSISGSWSGDKPYTLFEPSEADLFTIDSTTPFLWLPEAVCTRLEDAFGIVYNDLLQLYLLNTTQQQTLANANISFTFDLSDYPGSHNGVSLQLSYKAFDLALSYGFPGLESVFPQMGASSPSVPYLPVRKAANSTQYTIGRMFLQEIYLIVDYQRNNFSISQAKFNLDAIDDQALMDIDPPDTDSPEITDQSSQGLNSGAWIGIAIGALVGIVTLTLLVCFFVFRRRALNRIRQGQPPDTVIDQYFTKWFVDNKRRGLIAEMDNSKSEYPVEMGAGELPELPTDIHKAIELPASEKYRGNCVVIPLGHNPQIPLELPSDVASFRTSNVSEEEISPVSPELSDYSVRESSYNGNWWQDGTESMSPIFSPVDLEDETMKAT